MYTENLGLPPTISAFIPTSAALGTNVYVARRLAGVAWFVARALESYLTLPGAVRP
jgi:translation elongation factor EF-1alpha